MPLTLRRGRVTAIVEELEGLLRLEVDGAVCLAYPSLTGPVELEDEVLVNVQSRELELGSGGFDVLYANLTRGLELPVEEGAHVMKLPYTPSQFATVHAEELGAAALSLGGLPVVACTLHSQLAPVCAGLAGVRVTYVQLPGGALPVQLSDAVRTLKARRLLDVTISVGSCFGGDVECVGVHSALLTAQERGAQAVVCAVGPGVVGTGSRFGHGGMSAWHALAAAHGLEGRGVLAVRVSGADPRPRHHGISHHTEAVLSFADDLVAVPFPAGAPFAPPVHSGTLEVDVTGWREACTGLPLEHMGRGADDDPWFFAAAFAAGRHARVLATDPSID